MSGKGGERVCLSVQRFDCYGVALEDTEPDSRVFYVRFRDYRDLRAALERVTRERDEARERISQLAQETTVQRMHELEMAAAVARVERDAAIEALRPFAARYDAMRMADESERVGQCPICTVCSRRKKPIGRSTPLEMANGLCDDDCEGYRRHPQPDHLWPGESATEFGYPVGEYQP